MEEVLDLIENEHIFQANVQGAKIKKKPRARRISSNNINDQFKEAMKKGLPVVEQKGGASKSH